MTLTSTSKPQAPGRRRRAGALVGPLVALLLGAAAGLVCRAVAGAQLGLFFGGVAFVTILVPPLVLAERSLRLQLCSASAVVTGTAGAWLLAVSGGQVAAAEWLACVGVLAAYAGALTGLVLLLGGGSGLHGRVAAAALVTGLGLLWLTWPVWLSRALPGWPGAVDWLVPAHPLFAANAVLGHFDFWDRYPRLAYPRLMNLNQDVTYAAPAGVTAALLLHGVWGLVGVGGRLLLDRRRRGARSVRNGPAPAPAR